MRSSQACFVALLVVFVLESHAQTIVLRAGNLVDPATGTVSRNQTILIKGTDIAEIGGKIEVPNGAQVIDLSNAWVLPGLMDAHTHVTFSLPSGLNIEGSYLVESSGFRALLGAHNARLILEAGFTTVKDIGNEANYASVDLRRAIQKGWFKGPTIITTGKIIAPFGGQSHGIPPEQGRFWQFEYIDADTPEEIRKAVRQNIYYGANAIKLVSDNSAFFYSQEEVRAAVTEAQNAGMTVAVHAYGGEAAKNAILAGAASIEHGFELSDELLKLMKEKGTFLVGTDFPESHLKNMLFNPVANGKTLGERIVDRLKRAHRAGVKLAFGTDVVTELPGKNRADMMLDYFDVWMAAEVPPREILKALTTNAADLLRLQKKRGAIAPGLAADIIATPENPLNDISALRRVSFVMKDGAVIKHNK